MSKTLKEAYNEGPGPDNSRETTTLFLKGVAMGTADIIPGVSGGTIAFITGIYYQLINAISSFNGAFVKKLLKLQILEAISVTHLKFLIPLFAGIILAVLSTARLMHYLLKHYTIPTWALFFGLICASIFVVSKSISKWKTTAIPFIIVGAIFGYTIVGLIPVTTPESYWFLFLCGVIAICAMILPGISGAFLLLILGKYQFITGAIKAPFVGNNPLIILVVVAGCIVGLLGFSRVLKYFLKSFPNQTLCLLTGLMIGSLRKVWPWKEVLETQIIRGKMHVLRDQNIVPEFNNAFFIAIGLMVVGVVLVIILDRFASKNN